jgi:hypothetical protein
MVQDTSFVITQRIFSMLSGILFGALLGVGFLVTPTLFNVLYDKQVAGMIAGEIFKNTSFFSLVVSVFLLIYANLLVKRELNHYKLIRWLLLSCICLTLIGAFVVQPMMTGLRELALNQGAPVMQSPQAKSFGILHQLSSALFTIEVVIYALIFWKSTNVYLRSE